MYSSTNTLIYSSTLLVLGDDKKMSEKIKLYDMEYEFFPSILKALANDIPDNEAKKRLMEYDRLVSKVLDDLDTQASNSDSLYNVYYELGQMREEIRRELVELREKTFKAV